MKMRAFNALYWLMGLMIGLGAFGHGFLGVKPLAEGFVLLVATIGLRGITTSGP